MLRQLTNAAAAGLAAAVLILGAFPDASAAEDSTQSWLLRVEGMT